MQGRFSTMPLSCRAMDPPPKRPGLVQAQPPQEIKHSKLVGGEERKGGRGGEKEIKHGPSMKWGSTSALMACLGWQGVVVAFAALALAAEDDGSGQKEEGGGDQQEEAEASKDPHNLCSVPDNRRPGVAQFVPTGPFVIVDQEEVIIQGLQTVPAEGMFAVLAHHLCTALIPLDVHFTFRTALDWCVVLFVLIERAVFSWQEGGNGQVVLLAGLSRVPVGLAGRAELEGTYGALDQLGQRRRIGFL